MTDQRGWTNQPAIGVAITKLLSLQARMLRVEAAKRLRAAVRTAELLRK